MKITGAAHIYAHRDRQPELSECVGSYVPSASSASPLASAAPVSHSHPGHPTIAADLRLLQRNLKAKRSGILSLTPQSENDAF